MSRMPGGRYLKRDSARCARPNITEGAAFTGSCGAYPSLGVAVRAWCLRRGLDCLHARASKDLVEGASELGVAVPDEEAERGRAVAEVHQEVAGLLGSPGAVRVGGHAEDLYVPGHDLHDEQDVQTLEEDRVDMEEIARQEAISLSTRNVRQEVSTFRGAGLNRRARRIRRTVASLIW
jgi:hypothetical protein